MSGEPVLAAEVNRHIEDIYKALDIQMKRMGQMQVQIDGLLGTVNKLSVT